MRSYEKLNNVQLNELLELSLKNTTEIKNELLSMQNILSKSDKLEDIDLHELKKSLITAENYIKSSISSESTIDSINNCITSWINSEVETILMKYGLKKVGETRIAKNKLDFVINLRPGKEIVYFTISLNTFNVDYIHSIEILNQIDGHLEYLKDTIYEWRTVNGELRILKDVLCNQKKLNKFFKSTNINNIISDLGISKYSIINKYYKNIMLNRINSIINNNEEFIGCFKEHVKHANKVRTAIAQVYDDDLIYDLNNIVNKKRD